MADENFIIRNSLFDIRYSLRAYGKCIINELPAAEGLVIGLPSFSVPILGLKEA
jgi:hypothetical protein